MSSTHKQTFSTGGVNHRRNLAKRFNREAQAKKAEAAHKEKAVVLNKRNAFFQEARRKDEAEAARSLEQSRLKALKAGGPVTFREVGTTVDATVRGITEDPKERKKLYGSLAAFRGGDYHVDLAPELIQFLSFEEQLIYEKFHSPVRGKH